MALDGKWKKVLLSGSNFIAAEITASEIGATSNGSDLLFVNSNGHFQSSSDFFINSNNDLEGPSFSGSFGTNTGGEFSGDGSDITGFTFGGFDGALKSGSGTVIVDSSVGASTPGATLIYSGSTGAHIRLHLFGGTTALYDESYGGASTGNTALDEAYLLAGISNSGLIFFDDSSEADIDNWPLAFNNSFAGGGIIWNGANIPGQSGGGILDINPSNGLYLNVSDTLSVDSASIVSTQNGHLGVDGTGIFVNTAHFVIPSDDLDIHGGTNITVSPVNAGIDIQDDPSFSITLDQTINNNITFADNVVLGGDLTIVNSSNVTQVLGSNSDLNIEDGFLLLNSGSSTVNDNGGIIVDTGNNIGGIRSGSAIAYVDGNSHTVLGNSAFRVGWALYSGSLPSNQVSTNTHTNLDTERFVDPRSHGLVDGPVGAPIVTAMHRTNDAPLNTSAYFYENVADGDSLSNYGAFYIESDDSIDNESNVFVFVPFDE